MKIGLSSLLFGGFDRDVALEETRRAGYDGIELCAVPNMGEHFHAGMSDCIYDGIEFSFNACGLILESTGCSGSLGTERFEGLVAATAKLGAPCMTLGTGGEMNNDGSWRETISKVRACIPVLEANNVRLAVKPHVRAAVYNTETAKRFMAQIDSEWVGLNIDNTHLQRHGDDPVAAVKALSEWVLTGRIRDFKSDDLGIGPIENQIPGKGQSDVKGYWDALGEYTNLSIVTVEMLGAKGFGLDGVRRVIGEAIATLRSYG